MDYKNIPQGWKYVGTMTAKDALALNEDPHLITWAGQEPNSVSKTYFGSDKALIVVLCRPVLSQKNIELMHKEGFEHDIVGKDQFSCFREPVKGESYINADDGIRNNSGGIEVCKSIDGGRRFVVRKKNRPWSFDASSRTFNRQGKIEAYQFVVDVLNDYSELLAKGR